MLWQFAVVDNRGVCMKFVGSANKELGDDIAKELGIECEPLT
jgi:hypothetical protein